MTDLIVIAIVVAVALTLIAVDVLLAILTTGRSWLLPRQPPVDRPRDPVLRLDQHRADRQVHLAQLQRGFRRKKGRS